MSKYCEDQQLVSSQVDAADFGVALALSGVVRFFSVGLILSLVDDDGFLVFLGLCW